MEPDTTMHEKIDTNDIKHNPLAAKTIHCIGIGGIGVSAVAQLLAQQGKIVTGSDASESEVTRKLIDLGFHIYFGERIHGGFSKKTELVIYSPAVPENHPERIAARKQHIVEMSYPEVVGHIMKHKFGIAVAGTHGKTTTTALLGHVFLTARYDPTIIVGSMVRDFGGTNEHLGKSKYVIIEADEYKASFLNYKPKIIILTCIDEDHLDYYRDIHHIISVFHEFILRLPPDGLLIANADDPNIASLLKKPLPFSVVTYGIQHGDIRATSIDFRKKTTRFVVTQGSGYDHVEINLKGQHNILNTLGVYACARHCDITEKKLIRSLKNFKGANRRFDVVVSSKNITIIDDYAHHPTELKAFISALRQSYASKKILLVFQPHQEDRFTKLFVQFALSFNGVDKILLTEIYRVEGRSDSKDTSHRLAIELQSRGLNAVFASSFNVAVKEILREIKNYDVIAFVGAGDVIELRKLVQKELHI